MSRFSTTKIPLPNNVTYANFIFTINAGAQLGVYQALATRAGGEALSAILNRHQTGRL